jgi:hypothetical protein
MPDGTHDDVITLDQHAVGSTGVVFSDVFCLSRVSSIEVDLYQMLVCQPLVGLLFLDKEQLIF